MVALSAIISVLNPTDSDAQRKKTEDQRRASQVVRMRSEDENRQRAREENTGCDPQEVRAKVIPHLKRADQYIRDKRLDLAAKEVRQAKLIDPLNIYVHAMEERIAYLNEDLTRLMAEHDGANPTMARLSPGTKDPKERTAPPQQESYHQLDQYLAAKDLEHAEKEFERLRTADNFNLALPGYQQRVDALQRDIAVAAELEQRKSLQKAWEHPEPAAVERAGEARQAVRDIVTWVGRLVSMKAWEQAIEEINKAKMILPGDKELASLEERVLYLRDEEHRNHPIEEAKQRASTILPQQARRDNLTSNRRNGSQSRASQQTYAVQHESDSSMLNADASRHAPPTWSGEMWILTYKRCLKLAWSDGTMGEEEQQILATLQESFGITEEDRSRYEQEAQWMVYSEVLVRAWLNGAITSADSELLDDLRTSFGISAEFHMKLERKVRQEILRRGNDQSKLVYEVSQTFAHLVQNDIRSRTTE